MFAEMLGTIGLTMGWDAAVVWSGRCWMVGGAGVALGITGDREGIDGWTEPVSAGMWVTVG